MREITLGNLSVELGDGVTLRVSTRRAVYSLRALFRVRRLRLAAGPDVSKEERDG